MKLTLGFSPCPNDSFIFYALLHKKISTGGVEFEPVIADVEQLNQMAKSGVLDVTKLSFAAYRHFQDTYRMLDAGSALGDGCGPLVISKRKIQRNEIGRCSVALPGELTTAHALFNRYYPRVGVKKHLLFSAIENSVLSEECELGVIIHENRFTYQEKGLLKVADLGEEWQNETGLPIPLGGIFMKQNFTEEQAVSVERMIRESVMYAFGHYEETLPYVKSLSQELDETIIRRHIQLYVNPFSLSLGEGGKKAVSQFLSGI
jgi:1,4-dihydroxy-6-naphthoate synthase